MLNYIDERHNVELTARGWEGKRAEVNRQIALQRHRVEVSGGLDPLRLITHLNGLLDEHAATRTNVKQAAFGPKFSE